MHETATGPTRRALPPTGTVRRSFFLTQMAGEQFPKIWITIKPVVDRPSDVLIVTNTLTHCAAVYVCCGSRSGLVLPSPKAQSDDRTLRFHGIVDRWNCIGVPTCRQTWPGVVLKALGFANIGSGTLGGGGVGGVGGTGAALSTSTEAWRAPACTCATVCEVSGVRIDRATPASSVWTSIGVMVPLDALKVTTICDTNRPSAVRTVAVSPTDRSGRDAAVRRMDAGVVAGSGAGAVGGARPLTLQALSASAATTMIRFNASYFLYLCRITSTRRRVQSARSS